MQQVRFLYSKPSLSGLYPTLSCHDRKWFVKPTFIGLKNQKRSTATCCCRFLRGAGSEEASGSLHHWGRLKPIRRHTAKTTGKTCGPADAKAGMLPVHGKTV